MLWSEISNTELCIVVVLPFTCKEPSMVNPPSTCKSPIIVVEDAEISTFEFIPTIFVFPLGTFSFFIRLFNTPTSILTR